MTSPSSDLLDQLLSHADLRLARQVHFIVEIDKLKTILRQTPLTDLSRRENDAEHSWHLATMAVLLHEYADADVDLTRVIKMLLIHDVVEIDAGDTFLYDDTPKHVQEEKERAAAVRLFGLLPEDQGKELRALWDEFEAHQSADARFARSMDRFQPFLHNIMTRGEMWLKHGVTASDVRSRLSVIGDGSQKLQALMESLLQFADESGFLAKS